LVFVGDDAVGDAGVDEGHLHAAVSEQRGDRFQAHPAVDRLGGQGVTQREGLADAAARGEHPVDEVGDVESDARWFARSQPTSLVVSSGVRVRADFLPTLIRADESRTGLAATAIAPEPPGVCRFVSSIFSARSAAARVRPWLATSRMRPSKSRNFARAWIWPLDIETNSVLPAVPIGSGGRPTDHLRHH